MLKRWMCGALAALVISPAPAIADGPGGLYARVLHAYQTSGSVPACQFSSSQLSTALGAVDTYGQQYYADFIAAIQTALASRAAGACSKHHHRVVSASSGGQPPGPRPPASVTSATSSGVPAPMIALGILAALGALAGILVTLGAGAGGSSEWRHAWAEARWRAGGIWGSQPGRRR